MKSRFLTLKPSGARIQVVEAGKGKDLLYLHGDGGHMPDDPLIAALAAKYRVVAPLLPGYGQSTGEDGLRDMLDVTLHALDVLEALKLTKPIVVGHSMGGMIAAEMAAIARTEVTKLCLLAPAGLWLDDDAGRRHLLQAALRAAGAPVPRRRRWPEAADVGRQHGGPGIPQAVPGDERSAARHGRQDSFPIPDRGLAQRLYRITAKTLIVWGREDVLIPPVYGDAFKRAISKAKLVRIAKAGHAVGQEKPAAVLKAIRDFF